MFFVIYGTNFKKRRSAKDKIDSILRNSKINPNSLLSPAKISKENYLLLESYIDAASLFGERIKIEIEDLLTKEETREFIYKNLSKMVESENIFILDEPFALPASFQKISRDLEKLGYVDNAFDVSEEKIDKDIEPFYLCELIEKRDKKKAWQEWQKIYLEWGDDEAQALHGAIWWKWKMIWSAYLDGDTRNYFKLYRLSDRQINYNKEEIEERGKELSLMAMKANNGEEDLMRSIEKFILNI